MDEAPVLRRLLRSGMRVVDVGANLGYYALFFARHVGREGEIICFEPEPSNVEELKRNIQENRLTNVRLVQMAVGMRDGRVRFACGINGTVREGIDQGGEEIEVSMVRLDSVISCRVDLLKIDVEGYEGRVLKGGEAVIEKFRPALFVEVYPWLLPPGDTVSEIVAFLRRYYRHVEFFEKPLDQSTWGKLASRYFGKGRVVRMSWRVTPEKEYEKSRTTPFWVVCTN
jgi:FkbM family methyltransferase